MSKSKQQLLDERYLRMARIWAENSYCERRQVGALIVRGDAIISDGYNGTPSGFENICEDENNKTKPYVLHAEANAITKVAKSNNSSLGATLYVTSSPCIECAKLIIISHTFVVTGIFTHCILNGAFNVILRHVFTLTSSDHTT